MGSHQRQVASLIYSEDLKENVFETNILSVVELVISLSRLNRITAAEGKEISPSKGVIFRLSYPFISLHVILGLANEELYDSLVSSSKVLLKILVNQTQRRGNNF